MGLATSDEPVPLSDVPEGLLAWPVRSYRQDGAGGRTEVRTRRRLRKLDRVELAAAEPPQEPVAFSPAEERWLLGSSQRRWASIVARYGKDSWPRAIELACAGVVRLRCSVDEQLRLGEPQGWVLSDEWDVRRAGDSDLRDAEREHWRERAVAAASAVANRYPELAAALRAAAPGSPLTPVLVFAAEDLVAGVVHSGPRAFSQAHFGHTKARDDVGRVLNDAGVPDDVLVALGVRRSSRIGVAGPVRARVGSAEIALDALDGPSLLRADQPDLSLSLTRRVPLVIVENLQAAETLADQLHDVALLYTAGPPSRAALRLIVELAAHATRVLLIPDADLGGVRIAAAVVRAVPAAEMLDIGALPHPAQEPWPAGGESVRGLQGMLTGPASTLAAACLRRGYPVEQELATVEAVERALGQSDSDSTVSEQAIARGP